MPCGVSRNFTSNPNQPWIRFVIIKIDSEGKLDNMTNSNEYSNGDKSNIAVSPNPMNKAHFIENIQNVNTIEIANSSGKIINRLSPKNNNHTLSYDVSHLQVGRYL